MRSFNKRIAQLHEQLAASSESTLDEDTAIALFLFYHMNCTAKPEHLAACTELVRDARLLLAVGADQIRAQLAAGENPTIDDLPRAAAYLASLPVNDPVPEHLAAQIAELFDTAWLQPWLGTVPDTRTAHRARSGCLLTVALETPDAEALRRGIARGDYDDRPTIEETYKDLEPFPAATLALQLMGSPLERAPAAEQQPPARDGVDKEQPSSTKHRQHDATTRRDDAREREIDKLISTF